MFISKEELQNLKHQIEWLQKVIGSEGFSTSVGLVKGKGLLGRIQALEQHLKLEYLEKDNSLPKYVKKV